MSLRGLRPSRHVSARTCRAGLCTPIVWRSESANLVGRMPARVGLRPIGSCRRPRVIRFSVPELNFYPLILIRPDGRYQKYTNVEIRGGPRNSDSLLRWDPDPGEGVWHATEETELSG